jgi:exo-1,4-beta-D-glucosaminidase
MAATYAIPHSSAEYERIAQTMEYDSERAMYEAYGKNKYVSTGVIQWMLNNAWPSMIWHLYDYYLDAGAGYFAAKKACEPLHIQYSYDDQSIVVVNSTYGVPVPLHAAIKVHNLGWKELYSAETDVMSQPDSVQRAFALPDRLLTGPDHLLFIELTLRETNGRVVSHNFYWVPTTLTSFDWPRTDYTHTPALRYEDLAALASLPQATLESQAEIVATKQGREVRLHLKNTSGSLAFQVHAAVRTVQEDLIAPVFWSENWIELTPGESVTLTALLPEGAPDLPTIRVEGWNVALTILTPTIAALAR